MEMHRIETFTATIYCGFKPGYQGKEVWNAFNIAEKICQDYCNEHGMGFTIEPTRFIYKDGNENGVRVGIINYPRYPKQKTEHKNIALEIAGQLMGIFEQQRVSIVCTDETIMLGSK